MRFHQVERGFGSFSRTFEFADRIDVDRVVGGPRGWRADDHAAQGAATPRAQDSGPITDCNTASEASMQTSHPRHALPLFGFVAGLVLTGRMRTAEDAAAQAPVETPDQGKERHRRPEPSPQLWPRRSRECLT